jgi:hypothetical protein
MEGLPVKRAVAMALGLCACGPPSLSGSLTEILDLHYKSSEVQLDSTSVSVRFVSPQGGGENVVLKVAGSLVGTTLTPPAMLDLAADAPDGNQRGQVSRNVLGDPRTTFPPLAHGFLHLLTTPVQGQQVTGDFSITFVEGSDVANGRTAFGSFHATVP